MAKVTVVFKDKRDGRIKVEVEFDPPIKKDKDATMAQAAAVAALEAVRDLMVEEEGN